MANCRKFHAAAFIFAVSSLMLPAQTAPHLPAAAQNSPEISGASFSSDALDTAAAPEDSKNIFPPSSSALPKRIMSGYWHSWKGGAGFIKLASVCSSWDVINISFAEPVKPGSTDGKMKFAIDSGLPDYGDKEFREDIKALQAKGKKIVLAIGGYEGYFSLTSASAAETFAKDINGIVNSYGFDGIDVDLEQTSLQFIEGDKDYKNPTSPKIVYMIQGLKGVLKGRPSSFILSFAPETMDLHIGYSFYGGSGGRGGAYIPIIYAMGNAVTYVQAQLYNSGPVMAPDGNYYLMGEVKSIVTMCKMVLNGFDINKDKAHFWPGLRPDQVVIGLPASANAAGSGQISNAGLQQAFTTLNSAYPGLRGIMAWSVNWDNFQNSNSFATQNRAFLNTLP